MHARRLISYAPNTMRVEDFELPDKAPPGSVLLEARISLISPGTEVANYRGITTQRQAVGPDWSKAPYMPGYSFAGTILSVGEGVAAWQAGDRVVTLARHASHAVVDAPQTLVAIPDEVSFDRAAFATLGMIALNGVRLPRIELGESVAVIGAGMVGQLAMQFARLSGGRPVVAIDLVPERLDLATRCGAHAAINPQNQDIEATGRQLTRNRMFDVVIEATGSPAAFNPALKLAGWRARVVALGSTRGIVKDVDVYQDIHFKGLTVLGAHFGTHPLVENSHARWTRANNMRVALDFIAGGALDVDSLTTMKVPASQGPEMFHLLATEKEKAMGILLDWTV